MAAAESELVKTGISGLDAILAGGIPRGNVILVEGAIGTGETTMGVEFVYRGAKEFGEPGVIVVFEVSPDKLARAPPWATLRPAWRKSFGQPVAI
ncbi:MAG: ATPase domain-containing protein [Betaproteobacteria bacterium]